MLACQTIPVAWQVAVIQTLSGTGSLSIAARFFQEMMGSPDVYVSDPTWGTPRLAFQGILACGTCTRGGPASFGAGNHHKIFPVYGLKVHKYR
jgi:hypothetical protein